MKQTIMVQIEATYTFDDESFSKKDVKSVTKHIHRWVRDTMRNEASHIPFYVKGIEYTTNAGKFRVQLKK